jgi:glycosyltransferase involved in cell wall biosynthesis
MRIELLTHGRHRKHTGIGRYVHTLLQHLGPLADVDLCQLRYLPLSERISPFRHLPVGIEGHRPGSIVHFPQITGCAMMLYRPYHPSVATVHDLGVLEIPEEWAALDPIARQLLRLSLSGLKKVDLTLCVSQFTRQSIIRQMEIASEKVVAIHSGVDHRVFREIAGAAEQLIQKYPDLRDCSRPWILYVGSEQPRKNLGTLLEAVAALRHEFPGVHLLKVGSPGGRGFREQTLYNISRLALEDGVRFFQNVPEEDLALFYNSVDLLVQPSLVEGFGFPVIEAMACGTPTICSYSGALPEVANGASIHCDAGSVSEFSSTMRELLQDEALSNELRQRGLLNAREYTWGDTAMKTLVQFQDLVASV